MFRQHRICVYLPFRVPPKQRGEVCQNSSWECPKTEGTWNVILRPFLNFNFWNLGFQLPSKRFCFYQIAIGLSWDNFILVNFCSAQNNVLWILHFSAKKTLTLKLDHTTSSSVLTHFNYWEGKSYLPQYSGLENSMDCIVHRVKKGWAHLGSFHFTTGCRSRAMASSAVHPGLLLSPILALPPATASFFLLWKHSKFFHTSGLLHMIL